MRRLNWAWLSLLLGMLAFTVLLPSVHSQQLAKRLILKDGSYQLATKWEVKGDRVRYLSAERNEWEELPDSLVDWPATDKFLKDRAAGIPTPEAAEIDKEVEAERRAEEAKNPEVSPGLRLPEDGGMFLLDTFQTQPQLVMLQQSGGELNRNTKGNILRAAINPLASGKQTIELDGPHAVVQAHATLPAVYINLDRIRVRRPAPLPARNWGSCCSSSHSSSHSSRSKHNSRNRLGTVITSFESVEEGQANHRKYKSQFSRQSQPARRTW